ncbi:MAG: GTP-binding protein [Bacillota bacterium]|nr:GTP-binding protein [Bacillota bacterium]
MTKIDIFSGFLGAGKTTLIRKLIKEGYKNEKLVLIENEFGEIAIDGGFLKDAGVQITEMNSGCICCTLVGDFTEALKKVIAEYNPDRIIIEPSGVGKLSDVARAVDSVEGVEIGAKVTVVDAGKCRMYIRNFGEFFNDQVQHADVIVLSRTDSVSDGKVVIASAMLAQQNGNATIITTPWDEISGEQIVKTMENVDSLSTAMRDLEHYHEKYHLHEGEHHHEHDEHCGCGHDHHDHDHHHADEIFTSWGVETPKKFSAEEIENCLKSLQNEEKYGMILRAKGFVDAADGEWIYFDYVPGESDIRRGGAEVTGRICVIGSKINEQAIKELFNIG